MVKRDVDLVARSPLKDYVVSTSFRRVLSESYPTATFNCITNKIKVKHYGGVTSLHQHGVYAATSFCLHVSMVFKLWLILPSWLMRLRDSLD
ncbi:hypothetical protein Plhal304r1_c010g0039071 [Plasmopara halstedii]